MKTTFFTFTILILCWAVRAQQTYIEPQNGHMSFTLEKIVVSSDDKILISVENKSIIVWDIVSGIQLKKIYANGNDFFSTASLTPNSKFLAAGTINGNLYLWETDGYKKVFQKSMWKENNIWQMEFYTGSLLFITTVNSQMVGLNIRTKEIIDSIGGFREFSIVGDLMYSNAWGKVVKNDMKTLRNIYSKKPDKEIRTFMYANNGKVLVGDLKYVYILQEPDLNIVGRFPLPKDFPTRGSAQQVSSGYFACFSDLNSKIYVNNEKGTDESVLTTQNLRGLRYITFFHKSPVLATASWGGRILLWDIREKKLLRELSKDEGFQLHFSNLTLSENQDRLYFLGGASEIKSCDLNYVTAKNNLSFVETEEVVRNFTLQKDNQSNDIICFLKENLNTQKKEFFLWNPNTNKMNRTDFQKDPGSEFNSYVYKQEMSVVRSQLYRKGMPIGYILRSDDVLQCIDIQNLDIVNTTPLKAQRLIALSPDSKTLIAEESDEENSTKNYLTAFDLQIKQTSKKFRAHEDELSWVGFISEGQYLVSSTIKGEIKIWNRNNYELKRTIQLESPVRISDIVYADKKNLLIISAGRLIHFVDFQTGEIVAIFNSNKANDWVIYTPDGYFDCSQNGGELISIINNGKGYRVDQLAYQYNRPDIILQRLKVNDNNYITHLAKSYQKRIRKLGISESANNIGVAPTVEVKSFNQENNELHVSLFLSAGSSSLSKYRIFVNDILVETGTATPGQLTANVNLGSGKNKVEFSCTDILGMESLRVPLYFDITNKIKSDVYLLAFGVSKYQNPSLDLRYAHKDALDLEKTIQKMKGKGFANVFTKVLTNEQVTPETIKASKDFVKNAKVDDTFVLFIAGHGVHDTDPEATYYFLTSNADLKNLKGTAADFEMIEDLLQGIPPRNKLFLMDACESGEIDEETYEDLSGFKNLTGLGIASRGFKKTADEVLEAGTSRTSVSAKRTYLYQKDRYIYNDLVRRSGAIVFSSSKGGELSYERSDIENGLFTEYIIKAFTTTEADTDKNGTVTTDELRIYVSAQVAKASGDLQHPTVDRDNIYQKFGFQVK